MGNYDSGKIARHTFDRTIWEKTGAERKEVLAGPRYGVDVSVVRLPDGKLLASASDPASLIPTLGLAESAWLTVHLTANDLATTGHRPMYAQFVLNLPIGITDSEFEAYWGYIDQYCQAIGVSITGGHTGKVHGQESTFAGGVTMSLVAEKVLLSSNIRSGCTLIMTKSCALSASAILAKSFPETVKSLLGESAWKQLSASFWETSVLKEALLAANNGRVIAMHDVTEGGVLGAIGEMCGAGGCGAIVWEDALPVDETIRKLAEQFEFDPARTLGTGALLIACETGAEDELVEALTASDVPAHVIGYTSNEPGAIILKNRLTGKEALHSPLAKDPYWKAYLRAVQNEWK